MVLKDILKYLSVDAEWRQSCPVTRIEGLKEATKNSEYLFHTQDSKPRPFGDKAKNSPPNADVSVLKSCS
jgi:hypothetical protein